MKVVLHIGAHRTATTTFQRYMRRHAPELQKEGIGFWGPLRLRDGALGGLGASDGPTEGRSQRIRADLRRSKARGLDTLLVSDENMLGTMRGNLRACRLYPQARLQMRECIKVFEGQVARIVLRLRPLEDWWPSAAAYAVSRGASPIAPAACEVISQDVRGWRDVICDISEAAPGVEIIVVTDEAARIWPDDLLRISIDAEAPADLMRERVNPAPLLPDLRLVAEAHGSEGLQHLEGAGRWKPFTETQSLRLRELYQDDLFWLRSGAEGRAKLIERPLPKTSSKDAGAQDETQRGQPHVGEKGPMAQPGRR